MNYTQIWYELLPILTFIVVGYSLARWRGMSADDLETLLRYVLLPIVIFSQLEARIPFKTLATVGIMGAAMATLSRVIVKQAPRFLSPKVDMSSALPNIAAFLIPFLVLSYGSRGVGTACAFYVGAVLALHFLESRKNLPILLKEPWVYAVLAAILFRATNYTSNSIDKMLNPLLAAAYPILLVFLGASLHPLEGLKNVDTWVTSAARMCGGFVIGMTAIFIFRPTPAIREGVILASLAPPTTKLLSLAQVGGTGPLSKAASTVGTVLFLIVIVILMKSGWEPWNLF